MPRKKLQLDEGFPVHISARLNNKENYPISFSTCWRIYYHSLKKLKKKYGFKIHAFVMMSNHYHLVITPRSYKELGIGMNWFQSTTSKRINFFANKINHLYGGNYAGTAIENSIQYAHTIKYVLNNPVRANICREFCNYPFSSHVDYKMQFLLENPVIGIDEHIPSAKEDFKQWICDNYTAEETELIKKALKRRRFKISPCRKTGRMPRIANEL